MPLFAVESLRMLADRGLMVAEAEPRSATGSRARWSDLEVPPSVHALVAARLDRPAHVERRVLLDGAVLGEHFTAAGVAALTGVDERDVRSLADGLVAEQFLTVVSDPRSPERGQYAFAHALVQRVAQGTLSKHDRKACHLAAVEHLSGWATPTPTSRRSWRDTCSPRSTPIRTRRGCPADPPPGAGNDPPRRSRARQQRRGVGAR